MKRAPVILVCICVALFVLGILQLIQLRFEQGDVYPPYSSLRADPLGTMALYESLERVPGMIVRRDFSARNQLPQSRDVTYLHLAGDPDDWRWMSDSMVQEIERFMNRGGRLVVAFEPTTTGGNFFGNFDRRETNAPPAKLKKKAGKKPAENPTKPEKPEDGGKPDEDPFFKVTDLRKHWGFTIDYEKLPRKDDKTAEPVTVTNDSNPTLPASLTWHSATLFTKLSTNWTVVYSRGADAVVIERSFGKGTMLLASDSFFASNEALQRDRQAALLAWVVGPNKLIVFDEAHLGVVEQPGVATLMRRYRLHGFVAGLALLMGLFVWKNSFSLVPPPQSTPGQQFVAGRESADGFVNLLRRSIPAGQVLKVCLEQWEKSVAARRDVSPARAAQVRQLVAAEISRSALEHDPITAYQQAANILKPGATIASVRPSTSKANA